MELNNISCMSLCIVNLGWMYIISGGYIGIGYMNVLLFSQSPLYGQDSFQFFTLKSSIYSEYPVNKALYVHICFF